MKLVLWISTACMHRGNADPAAAFRDWEEGVRHKCCKPVVPVLLLSGQGCVAVVACCAYAHYWLQLRTACQQPRPLQPQVGTFGAQVSPAQAGCFIIIVARCHSITAVIQSALRQKWVLPLKAHTRLENLSSVFSPADFSICAWYYLAFAS